MTAYLIVWPMFLIAIYCALFFWSKIRERARLRKENESRVREASAYVLALMEAERELAKL